ncbi:MAG: hypothetical protein OXI87_12965 [Albidovulum sp.]|nr:hypothetical protein [Albidovulum sp.]
MNADGIASFQRAWPLELARLAGTPTPFYAEARTLVVGAPRDGCATKSLGAVESVSPFTRLSYE